MLKKIFVFLFIFSLFCIAQEQPQKYWIYFKDKNITSLNKTLNETNAQFLGISERALKRRARVSALLDESDFPVSQLYVEKLLAQGITIEQTSRWFNGVSAFLTIEQKQKIETFSFVKEIVPVKTFIRRELQRNDSPLQKMQQPTADRFNYGSSYTQMNTINAIAVHNIRITGRGVLVGMLDSGFRWKSHEALKDRTVIAEHDFIQNDDVTENQGNDRSDQDAHGTATMSTLGGFKEGQLIGPAFNADFILGKTEYVPTETNIEEDNWVAGIEWMELHGVDIVSSSLGYSEFDLGQKSYTYQDMNGKTATTTKAAVIAARKGVVVVIAMGNEGASSWRYLTSPADADSIISVGAVTSAGVIASFSSVGPTSDGRMKPDVVAQGTVVYSASTSKNSPYIYQQGTSLSTPLTAGVAAMILSAFPELTPVQVRNALRNTASNSASPNNTYGWGMINAYNALTSLGIVISTDPEITLTSDSNYQIGFYVVSNTGIKKDSVKIFYSHDNGATFKSISTVLAETLDAAKNSGKYSAVVPKNPFGGTVKFYARAVDSANSARSCPFQAPAVYYDTQTGITNVKHERIPTSFVLEQNFPNPFNPATTIRYEIPEASIVTLKVFDVLGREVATLVQGEQSAKAYSIPFTAHSLASGMYIYQLRAKAVNGKAEFVQTRKMVVTK